jgi:lipopolysaccharide/colanic/teichoic acid biosynthesis glycosyltransferase
MLDSNLKNAGLEAPAPQPNLVARRLGCVLAADEVPALLGRLKANTDLVLRAVWVPGDDGSAAAAIRAEQPNVRLCSDLADFVEVYDDLDLAVVSDREGIVTREAALALIELALMYDARIIAFEGVGARTPRYTEIWQLGTLLAGSRDDILRRAPDPEAVARLTRLIDQGSRGRVAKRVVDLVVSALALVLTAPLMALVALAVRLDTPGPALFVQERLGYLRRPFRIVKFRSMYERPPAVTAREPAITQENDARVTRVGRFLRISRLDELPQLLNVLKGEMSIVGPRPIRAFRADELAAQIPFYDVRFVEKPGLTGSAQVYYKYPFLDVEHVIKFKYEFKYVKQRSMLYDLKLMALTALVLLGLKGA